MSEDKLVMPVRCRMSWSGLRPTTTEGVRDCGECRRPVYEARSEAVLRGYAAAGQCVAITRELAEKVGIGTMKKSRMTGTPCVVSMEDQVRARVADYQMPSFMGRVDLVPAQPKKHVRSESDLDRLEESKDRSRPVGPT